MATLYISWFASVGDTVALDPIKSETVTTSTSNAQSGACPGFAKFAKIQSDTASYVASGSANPDATAQPRCYVGANEVFWLRVAGPTHKIAAITA